jgi:hypothetical protein
MDNNKNPVDTRTIPLRKKHWLFQTIPPLLMFSVLFTTNNGTALVFISGFFLLPVLFSFISIIAKFIRYNKRKYYMLRPFLTIFNFSLIVAIAIWTYDIALEQAEEAAEIIHTSCNTNLVCPEAPEGWNVTGSRISRSDLGIWFKYTASYSYQTNGFDIRLYHGPDVGHVITGGINDPVEVVPYVEE